MKLATILNAFGVLAKARLGLHGKKALSGILPIIDNRYLAEHHRKGIRLKLPQEMENIFKEKSIRKCCLEGARGQYRSLEALSKTWIKLENSNIITKTLME